jgi:hypothetical protein
MLAAGQINPGVSVLWGANTNDSIEDPDILKLFVSEKKYVKQLNETIRGDDSLSVSGPRWGSPPQRHRRRRRRHHHRRRQQQAAGREAAVDEALYEDLLRRALELYPPRRAGFHPDHPFGDNADIAQWYQSDQYLCETRRTVKAAGAALDRSGGRAFSYRYDWFFQSDKRCIGDSNYHDPSYGSIHCDEMTFVFGQPIFDNQDAPGFSYTNCSDPASAYYDPKHCTGCAFDAIEARFSATIGRFWAGGNGRFFSYLSIRPVLTEILTCAARVLATGVRKNRPGQNSRAAAGPRRTRASGPRCGAACCLHATCCSTPGGWASRARWGDLRPASCGTTWPT